MDEQLREAIMELGFDEEEVLDTLSGSINGDGKDLVQLTVEKKLIKFKERLVEMGLHQNKPISVVSMNKLIEELSS